jgi:hypothetical protein
MNWLVPIDPVVFENKKAAKKKEDEEQADGNALAVHELFVFYLMLVHKTTRP